MNSMEAAILKLIESIDRIAPFLEALAERASIQCEVPKDRAFALAEEARLHPKPDTFAQAEERAIDQARLHPKPAAPTCATGPAVKQALEAELPVVPGIEELVRLMPKPEYYESASMWRSQLEALRQYLDSARSGPQGSVDHLKAAAVELKNLGDKSLGAERMKARKASVGYPKSSAAGLPTVKQMADVIRSPL